MMPGGSTRNNTKVKAQIGIRKGEWKKKTLIENDRQL